MDSATEILRRDQSRNNSGDAVGLSPPPSHKNSVSFQTLESKLIRAKKRIQEEQRRRDANVEEYLKMAAVAQRNQLPQVKALFEKRNTKAATHIAGLQRKVERYQRDIQGLELHEAEMSPSKGASGLATNNTSLGSPKIGGDGYHGSEASGSSNTSSHRASKGRLQHVSQGIKTVISKPREIASYLLKQKFGSADNIPHHVREADGHYHGSAHIPSNSDGVHNISAPVHSSHNAGVEGGEEELLPGSDSVSARSSSLGRDVKQNSINTVVHSDLLAVVQQMNELRDDLSNLREDYENFKNQVSMDSTMIYQGLQEEKFRAERLEEQVNDLTELHQAETGNLKQALADAEEKLSYQSEERLRDLAEMLDSCQTKISRLEQQQQQLVTIEGIENSAARALVVKLVNIGLTFLQLLLLLVATVASTLAPFVGSRIRFFASIFIALLIFLAHRKWPHAHVLVLDFWTDLLNRL